MVPAPQAPPTVTAPASVDLSAGMVPVQKPTPPQPAQDAITQSLMDNPKGEGIYHLKGPAGVVQVPYSKIPQAAKQGYFFANKDDLHKYARDYSADPINETAVDHYLDTAPWWDMPSHVANLLLGAGTGVQKTFTGMDRPPTSSLEQNMQLAAAKPAKTAMEGVGDLGENVGEFFSGEELLGLLGKGLSSVEKFKQAQQLSGLLQKSPLVAKLLRVGVSAAKTGAIGGAQTLAKTGDPDAALDSAALAGATDFGLGAITDFGRAGVAAARAPSATADAAADGAQAYSAEARRAVEPHLTAINDAVEAGRPSAAAPQGAPGTDLMPRNAIERPGAAGAGAPPQPQIPRTPTGKLLDVDHILSQVHDFTGAADRLTEVNKAGYEALEQITGAKFRDLNDEVQAAQKAVWRGQPGAEEIYKAKQAEMDKLIDSTKGAINRETVDALKASWRQSYMLRDFGRMWDKSVNGVPGASRVSSEQRGVDGKVLMKQLQNAVNRYGRFQIDRTLGPGRLEVLERIAEKTSTRAGRADFYQGLRSVLTSMHHGAVIGGVGGHFLGSWAGGAAVGAAGGAAFEGIPKVLDAIKANPKIAQHFLFALDSGASAEKYAPFVAEMIQRNATESEQENAQ